MRYSMGVFIHYDQYLYVKNIKINIIHERWLSIKCQLIVSELSEILIFTQHPYFCWNTNIFIYSQIDNLIWLLKWWEKHPLSIAIIDIITKYLNSMYRFLSRIQMQGCIFYIQLFESIFIGMIRDIQSLGLAI